MYFPFVPQFFLIVLIICPLFGTVTFRSGNTLKQQTFFSFLFFSPSIPAIVFREVLHPTLPALFCFSPSLFVVGAATFQCHLYKKWLYQFQSMLGLLIQTTQHPQAACLRFSLMSIVRSLRVLIYFYYYKIITIVWPIFFWGVYNLEIKMPPL